MAEILLTKENFEKEVLQSGKEVLVDFWAVWCSPCRMLSPVIGEIAAERGETLVVGKVNVDEQPELAAKYHVSAIPTVIIFKDGKADGVSIGYRPKEELEALL